MNLASFEFPIEIMPSYSIDSLYFEYYLFLGFVLGALTSFLLLIIKSKRQDKI